MVTGTSRHRETPGQPERTLVPAGGLCPELRGSHASGCAPACSQLHRAHRPSTSSIPTGAQGCWEVTPASHWTCPRRALAQSSSGGREVTLRSQGCGGSWHCSHPVPRRLPCACSSPLPNRGGTAEPNTSPGPSLVAGVKLRCPANWGRGSAELGERGAGQGLQSLWLVGWEGGPGACRCPCFARLAPQTGAGSSPRGLQAAATISQHRWRARERLPSQPSLGLLRTLPSCCRPGEAKLVLLALPPAPSMAALGAGTAVPPASSRRLQSRPRLFPEPTALGLEAPLGPEPCTARAGRRHAASKPRASLGCGLGMAWGQAQGCVHSTLSHLCWPHQSLGATLASPSPTGRAAVPVQEHQEQPQPLVLEATKSLSSGATSGVGTAALPSEMGAE